MFQSQICSISFIKIKSNYSIFNLSNIIECEMNGKK